MALIIGDGQIKYFSKYVQDSRIQMYYSSGCRVEELVQLPAMKEAIPAASVIVVHCGINNLPGDSAEALLEKFQRLYDDIKEVNPAANIVFSSMLPMTTGPKRTPKSILKKSKKNLFEPLETDVPDPKRTKLEIPLLECSNSADIPDNDLVNLSDSRNDNVNLEDLPDGGFGPCNELNVRTEVTLRQT